MNVLAKFEMRSFSALPVPEIIGVPKNLGSLWIRPRSLFSKLLMGFCSDGSCYCSGRSPKLKFAALPVSEIIAIGVFGGGCEP